MARVLRLDPSRIVLIGHSMGGFMAVQDAAVDAKILGVALISAADLGGRIPQLLQQHQEQAAIKVLNAAYEREGMAPLSGCTPQGLARGNAGACRAMGVLPRRSTPCAAARRLSSVLTMPTRGRTRHLRPPYGAPVTTG